MYVSSKEQTWLCHLLVARLRIKQKWQNVNEAVTSTCQEVLSLTPTRSGYQQRRFKKLQKDERRRQV
ncbi:hypothetical protein DPMN_058990 [Dreissena polymorpha]|uniref:Uncharacterized protein n=1 Tax=Dreissena polymorpha TaxID=45954 RepID=A0A9D4HGT3_DREPO|nr:hypothetical protein DPMN_058990 [Dreissena polymorpha]